MELNEKIKNLREESRLTMSELAEKVGVSASTIMRYETGAISNLKRDKIKALADALNTTPAYLMGWTDFPYDLDKDSEFYFPSEYQKTGMSPEDYFYFKQTEFEEGMRESASAPAFNTYCTKHESKVLDAYREHTEMRPAVDKLLGVVPEQPEHLMPVAAHNDNPDEGQQELMKKDLDKF